MEIPKIYKSLFPKCILSKYLLKIYVQIKITNVIFPSTRSACCSYFDLYQINPVKVSRRDGINYVFNGQHTIEIVALVSGSRETPVWCMVYDDLVYTQEADIFANQMKYVKSLLPYEIFMANIEAGNDRELIIRDLVESYDLTITSSSRPGGICAVSTLINIYEKYGFHTLDSCFTVFVLPHGKVRLCPLVPICLMLLPVWIMLMEKQ